MRKANLILLVIIFLIFNAESFLVKNLKIQQTENSNQISKCNVTNFQYRTHRFWSKSDLLNRTLAKYNEKSPTLANITWSVNDSVTYTIYDIKISFRNLTQDQKVQSVSKTIIMLENAFIETSISFKWLKTSNNIQSETIVGMAKGVSEQLAIAIQFNRNGQAFEERLLSAMPFSQIQLVLTSVDRWVEAQEKQNMVVLLNQRPDCGVTVRKELNEFLNSVWENTLKESLMEENIRKGNNFSYSFTNTFTSKSYMINFTRRPQLFFADNHAVSSGYEVTIDNYTNSKCGPSVPTEPCNLYDDVESMISFTFIQNLIDYASEQGMLDQVLSPEFGFEYTASDLEGVMNNYDIFDPSTPITGYCIGKPGTAQVEKNNSRLASRITFQCEIKISNTTVLNLDVTHGQNLIETWNNGAYYFTPEFRDCEIELKIVPGFQIDNKWPLIQMAYSYFQTYVRQKSAFGSGFPLYQQMDFAKPQINLQTTFVSLESQVPRSVEKDQFS